MDELKEKIKSSNLSKETKNIFLKFIFRNCGKQTSSKESAELLDILSPSATLLRERIDIAEEVSQKTIETLVDIDARFDKLEKR